MRGAFVPVRRRVGRAAGELRAAFSIAWSAAPRAVLVHCVLAAGAGLVPVAAAALIGLVFDGLAASSAMPAALALAVAVLVIAGLVPLRGYVRARMLRQVTACFLDRLYAAVDRMPGIARLEDPRFCELLRSAGEPGRSGPGPIVDDVAAAGSAVLTALGFLVLAAAAQPGPALLLLAAAVMASAAGRVPLAPDRASDGDAAARRAAYFGRLLTGAAAAKEVRLLRLGGFLRSRARSEALRAHAVRSRQDRRDLAAHAAVAVPAAVIAVLALLWGVLEVGDGSRSVGDLAVLMAALSMVPTACAESVRRASSVRRSLPVFRRHHALDAVQNAAVDHAGPPAVPGPGGGIELTDVWFRYAPDRPWVLRGVSFVIPFGHTVALVGLNGAGKSTLVKLLCRFYEPTLGSIRWDGRDIRRMPVEELRSRIGAVFQDFMRYDLSAAENIGIGDLATLGDAARTHEAARLAGVHEALLALPCGYETPLSDSVLSGGQWQRIAMARAFLRDERDLMILDEPASGLDAYAESRLHEHLRRRRAGRTSVLISHRLSAVRDADLIVVLADGKVAERGSHAELLAEDGGYARLFRLQATGYAPEQV